MVLHTHVCTVYAGMHFVTYSFSLVADKRALFRFTSNATSQGKWYFFLDEHWHHAFNEPDCEKKIAMARFTGCSTLCLCVCVSVCVCACACMCVCLHACVWMCVCLDVRVHVCV